MSNTSSLPLDKILNFLWCYLDNDENQKDVDAYKQTISKIKNILENAAQGACFKGNVDALKSILEIHMQPTETMMNTACCKAQNDIIRILEDRGIEMNLKHNILLELALKNKNET